MSPYRNILCYVDTTSTLAQSSWPTALRLAQRYDARLTLADTVSEMPWYASWMDTAAAYLESAKADRRAALETRVEEARQAGVKVEPILLEGNAFIALTRQVIAHHHDLLVKTAMGEGRLGSIFGTTAKRLLRKCPCPVLLTRPEQAGTFSHVGVALDPRPKASSENAINHALLEQARLLAAAEGAKLSIVHAWQVFGESTLLDRMSPDEFESHRVAVREKTSELLQWLLETHEADLGPAAVELVEGEPMDAIPSFVQRAQVDLLVMGTVARPGIAGILVGNTAEQLIHRVPSSLLAIKPEGFRSPVQLDD
ncbi:MAG: hypothetical protein GC168_12385 [Candidatus Hydrogenedens sp.]|nr:hypothetical protein [Candidatus Hydrogenedens sp.]